RSRSAKRAERWREQARRGRRQFARRCRANLGRSRNAGECRANLGALSRRAAEIFWQRRTARVHQKKLPHIAEVRNAEAFSKPSGKTPGEVFHDALAVARTLRPALLDLDDLAPDEPVRLDHRPVDRTRNVPTRRLYDV